MIFERTDTLKDAIWPLGLDYPFMSSSGHASACATKTESLRHWDRELTLREAGTGLLLTGTSACWKFSKVKHPKRCFSLPGWRVEP